LVNKDAAISRLLPDLTISQAGVKKEFSGYSYSVVVSNIGAIETGPWEFSVKAKDSFPKIKKYRSLKPGESVVITGKFSKLPVTFTVDPRNLIKEQNEKNNTLTISSVTPLPPEIQNLPQLEGP